MEFPFAEWRHGGSAEGGPKSSRTAESEEKARRREE